MTKRLNQEREKRLQPKRIERANRSLMDLGCLIDYFDHQEIRFRIFKQSHQIKYFPYSGWHTGKGIKDGRGYNHLFNQIKEIKKSKELVK